MHQFLNYIIYSCPSCLSKFENSAVFNSLKTFSRRKLKFVHVKFGRPRSGQKRDHFNFNLSDEHTKFSNLFRNYTSSGLSGGLAKTMQTFVAGNFLKQITLLSPQSFGTEAKTRGGIYIISSHVKRSD